MARLYGPNRQHQGQQGKQAIKGQIQQNPMGRAACHSGFLAHKRHGGNQQKSFNPAGAA